MKPIEMLIFDVDGTLVIPENDEVPVSCIKALSLARSKGIKITIATGRNHYALGESLNQLHPDYVVGCCGCCVVDCHNDTMIDTHTISLHDTNLLTEAAIRYDLSLMFKFDDAMYFYTKPQGVGWLTEDYKKTVNILPDSTQKADSSASRFPRPQKETASVPRTASAGENRR